MDQYTLRAVKRNESGSRPSRRLRRENLVPATVYGHGMDAASVTVDAKDLFSVLHTEAGRNALISVEIGDGDGLLTVAREIQRHPVRGDITHVDLIRVTLDEKIEADVSLSPQGTPVGVFQDGGFVETIAATVRVLALPLEVPTSVEFDISELLIGDGLKVSDLPVIEGVEYLDEPDHPILAVLAPRVEEVEEVEVEVLLDEDGEPIEAADEDAEPAEPESDEE